MLTTVKIAVQVLRVAAVAEARQTGLNCYFRPDHRAVASIRNDHLYDGFEIGEGFLGCSSPRRAPRCTSAGNRRASDHHLAR